MKMMKVAARDLKYRVFGSKKVKLFDLHMLTFLSKSYLPLFFLG